MFGDEIQRVTGRKDEYHEVEEFICNTCRFDKKDVRDWTIEGPRTFEKTSVINRNKYALNVPKVEIKTEDHILIGREEDRKKISMTEVPFEDTENSKQ